MPDKGVPSLCSVIWSTAFFCAWREGSLLSLYQLAPYSPVRLRVSFHAIAKGLYWWQLLESMVLLCPSLPELLLPDLSCAASAWPDVAAWPSEELFLFFFFSELFFHRIRQLNWLTLPVHYMWEAGTVSSHRLTGVQNFFHPFSCIAASS